MTELEIGGVIKTMVFVKLVKPLSDSHFTCLGKNDYVNLETNELFVLDDIDYHTGNYKYIKQTPSPEQIRLQIFREILQELAKSVN